MEDPNIPEKNVASESVSQVGKLLQDIIAQLKGEPTFLFGIAAMLLAIVGVVALAFVPSLPSSLTWFPYALLLFGIVLIGFAYLKTPRKPKQQKLAKIKDTAKLPESEDSGPKIKTVKRLTAKLSRLSAMQCRILQIISESNGMYVDKLAEQLGITRDETVYRCKELERDKLISIRYLTDLRYELPKEYKTLFETKTVQKILQEILQS
jgi:hypothetical protein